ncbi:hypothetical protein H6P81_018817 [Aristolochia fimbriata]|uniref:Uncharacterized protein n=1 Tax=Aristolochia fimbriata TaxID=158543 RepID=A0AAV7E314_ARIFI|nr:hypothetical protein H6P81_018817 [Aristolochia fimbriata]
MRRKSKKPPLAAPWNRFLISVAPNSTPPSVAHQQNFLGKFASFLLTIALAVTVFVLMGTSLGSSSVELLSSSFEWGRSQGQFKWLRRLLWLVHREEGMCIAVWLWQSDPRFPLLLLLNRDELHDRPTKPIHWWDDSSQILGGKDCLAGGTWMACKRDGRIAFLTNVMEPNPFPEAKSRGNLPLRFLESRKSPLKFAEEVAAEADHYNGFNLILVDICSKSMVYISNRPKGEPVSIQDVLPGLHVLSNAKLDSPWHKAERLGRNFIQLLSKYGSEELPKKDMVELLMRDTVKAERARLPNTGADSEWELKLSSIFVDAEGQRGRYGTRSSAVLLVKANGEVSIYETYLEKGVWKDHTFNFQIQEA